MIAILENPVNSFDWLSVGSSLLGVLIGAALTYIVTRSFEARREKREQKAIAFALIFAIQRICNDLIQLTNVLRNISANRAQEIAEGAPLWQLMPIAFGWDEEIEIRPEELALLAGTKNTDLVMQVLEAAAAHRIYTRGAHRISELKLELAKSGLATSADGEVVTFQATAEQYAGIAHIISQLEALSAKMGDDLANATHQAMECGSKVPRTLKNHYKFDHLVGLSFDEFEAEENANVDGHSTNSK